jgi:hypothetical protein
VANRSELASKSGGPLAKAAGVASPEISIKAKMENKTRLILLNSKIFKLL